MVDMILAILPVLIHNTAKRKVWREMDLTGGWGQRNERKYEKT